MRDQLVTRIKIRRSVLAGRGIGNHTCIDRSKLIEKRIDVGDRACKIRIRRSARLLHGRGGILKIAREVLGLVDGVLRKRLVGGSRRSLGQRIGQRTQPTRRRGVSERRIDGLLQGVDAPQDGASCSCIGTGPHHALKQGAVGVPHDAEQTHAADLRRDIGVFERISGLVDPRHIARHDIGLRRTDGERIACAGEGGSEAHASAHFRLTRTSTSSALVWNTLELAV